MILPGYVVFPIWQKDGEPFEVHDGTKNEDITESEEERLQRELRAKEDQLNELIRENMRLNEMIENMETKYSTFISEREGIMQVEVGMYKDEFMGKLEEKLIQKLGDMVL